MTQVKPYNVCLPIVEPRLRAQCAAKLKALPPEQQQDYGSKVEFERQIRQVLWTQINSQGDRVVTIRGKVSWAIDGQGRSLKKFLKPAHRAHPYFVAILDKPELGVGPSTNYRKLYNGERVLGAVATNRDGSFVITVHLDKGAREVYLSLDTPACDGAGEVFTRDAAIPLPEGGTMVFNPVIGCRKS